MHYVPFYFNLNSIMMDRSCNLRFCILVPRRCYIRFIRKVNEKKGAEGLEETKKAFDFMLNYVGLYSLSLTFSPIFLMKIQSPKAEGE